MKIVCVNLLCWGSAGPTNLFVTAGREDRAGGNFGTETESGDRHWDGVFEVAATGITGAGLLSNRRAKRRETA